MAEISKNLTKIAKIIIKYTPFIIAIGYLAMSILSSIGITVAILPFIFRYSLCSFICLMVMSFLLNFCIWHRMPLYYAAVVDILNTIDYYFVIPISNKAILIVYLTIAILFIVIGMYLKEKYNAKTKHIKVGSTTNDR